MSTPRVSILYRYGLLVAATGLAVNAPAPAPAGTETSAKQEPDLVGGGRPLFVATGTGGFELRSGDGFSWKERPATVRTSWSRWRSRSRAKRIFVAVDNAGRIQTSRDGTNWIPRNAGVPFTLHQVAFGNGRFENDFESRRPHRLCRLGGRRATGGSNIPIFGRAETL